MLYRYSVRYRRLDEPRREYRITVTARTADDARRVVAIRDPRFHSTVESPRRRAIVVPA